MHDCHDKPKILFEEITQTQQAIFWLFLKQKKENHSQPAASKRIMQKPAENFGKISAAKAEKNSEKLSKKPNEKIRVLQLNKAAS